MQPVRPTRRKADAPCSASSACWASCRYSVGSPCSASRRRRRRQGAPARIRETRADLRVFMPTSFPYEKPSPLSLRPLCAPPEAVRPRFGHNALPGGGPPACGPPRRSRGPPLSIDPPRSPERRLWATACRAFCSSAACSLIGGWWTSCPDTSIKGIGRFHYGEVY